VTGFGAHQVPSGVAGTTLECVPSDVGQLWFPVSDHVMRPYISRHGYWEKDEGALLRRLVRPGMRFLDVGANVGYFSRFVAHSTANVHIDAVEPHPLLARILELNLWIGRVDATVWPVAVGSGARAASLTSAPTNPGDTRSAMSNLDGTQAQVVAPACAMDELLPDAKIDVAKIDVQGAEADVVSGMQELIRRCPNIAVVAEFWPTPLRESGRDPLDVLHGYRRQGLRIVTCIGAWMGELSDREVVATCASGGREGAVNLLLLSNRRTTERN
jgi:FkbM family methyltransferase